MPVLLAADPAERRGGGAERRRSGSPAERIGGGAAAQDHAQGTHRLESPGKLRTSNAASMAAQQPAVGVWASQVIAVPWEQDAGTSE